MKFKPLSDKEIAEMNLWPEGVYGFEILAATDEVSKSGNEMIKVKLAVFNNDGRQTVLFDYLLESMAFKLKHVAKVTGNLDKYEAGVLLAADLVGKSGNLKLKIQKDKTGQYPDKNVVADYVTNEVAGDPQAPIPAGKSNGADIVEDNIPFMAYQAFIMA